MTIRVLSTGEKTFRKRFAAIRERGAQTSAAVDDAAREIVGAVRKRGDLALVEFTAKFDRVALKASELRVPDAELEGAASGLDVDARGALELAAKRIAAFHRHQVEKSWSFRDDEGFKLGQQITPLRRVAVYVPGGHASYPSSVLMTAIPARVAGVDEVIMLSPAGPDGYNPAVLAAAKIAGVDAVYRIGGAQAVAAAAFGTRTVPKVDKIVGPGNAWVQAAKKLVYGDVDIDGMAGPSEVLVIADDSVDPAYAAADLLAQAEHGSGDECALLLTTSQEMARKVADCVESQLRELPRRKAIAAVLKRRGAIVVARDDDEVVAIAEEVAPEHLELLVRRPEAMAKRLRNAGAIFMGPFAPAPLGDYMAGPNHVLPTGGTARFFSPLGVYDFVKRTSVVGATRSALRSLAPSIAALATLEGYDAHAAAVRRRFR